MNTEPIPCERCTTMCRFVWNSFTHRLGWYLCPKCDEAEYYRHWPPEECKLIRARLDNDLKKAKEAKEDFEKRYRSQPLKTIKRFSK